MRRLSVDEYAQYPDKSSIVLIRSPDDAGRDSGHHLLNMLR